MPLLKTIALILIASLANPLCCCVSGQAIDAMEEIHACCAKGGANQTEPAKSHQDCPHQAVKASKISQAADAIDHGHKALEPIALLPLLSLFELDTSRVSAPNANARREPLPPRANPTEREYCVYLL